VLASLSGARRVLDVGCGSGRLTVALAEAGAAVTGFDTSAERLEEARRRAEGAGVTLDLVEADLNAPLPFADGAFDGVVSRLALMVARDPVATLGELRRVLEPGGRVSTVIWAALPENPWFAAPREAVAAVLGAERASFAGAFGRLGDTGEAAAVHRAAGFCDVEATVLRERRAAPSVADYWADLARENGHFRRVDATLTDADRAELLAELESRLGTYEEEGRLLLPRTLVLVTAPGG
jgi:SAM-dependent methyltransferase